MRTIKPVDEMSEDLKKEKAGMLANSKTRSLYKGQPSETDARLSVAIKLRVESLRNLPPVRINFRDIEDVKEKTFNYLDACSMASLYPSMIGLAVHGFGVSRQAMYNYMNQFPESETAKFLRMVSDMMADCIISDALRRRCDCVSAIFVLKNLYGFRDNVDPPITENAGDEAEERGTDYYKQKYGELLEE